MEFPLMIIALVLALPVGLALSALMSTARARWLALLAGIVGDLVVAVAIYAYVTIGNVKIDALTYFLGSLFACIMGVMTFALIANFLVGLFGRRPEVSSLEY
jgi:hypothetical protein